MRFVVLLLALAFVVAACGGESGPPGPFDEGKGVYGDTCSVCHGSAGEGGTGPRLDDVLATFASCDEQVKWISLGSARWKDEVGPAYGATNKPVEGAMPAMDEQLTTNEIAAVAAYERAQFGGLERDEALQQCGFAIVPAPGG